MAENSTNQDLQTILSELRNVLSSLTDEEKEKIEGKIEKKVEIQIEQSAITVPQEIIPEKPKEPIIQQAQPSVSRMEPLKQEIIPEKTIEPPKQEISVKQVENISEEKPPMEEEIPKDAIVIPYAIFYPAADTKLKQKFLNNLNETVKKSIKKNFYLKSIYEKPYDLVSTNWDTVISELGSNSANVAYFIHQIKFDPSLVGEKISKLNISFQSVLDTNLDKKVTYIDLAIELMLLKK